MSLEADKALEERGRHLRTRLLGTLQLNSRSLSGLALHAVREAGCLGIGSFSELFELVDSRPVESTPAALCSSHWRFHPGTFTPHDGG